MAQHILFPIQSPGPKRILALDAGTIVNDLAKVGDISAALFVQEAYFPATFDLGLHG